jgi:hypothetical protein
MGSAVISLVSTSPSVDSILVIDESSEKMAEVSVNYIQIRVFARNDDGSRGASADLMTFAYGFVPKM